MNKKGFTLVELLAVLFIILLLGSLVFVSINERGEEFKKMSYKKFEDMIETAAKNYVSENDKIINSLKRGDIVTIKVKDLIDLKYLNSKDLKNPKTYEYIDIENSNIKIEYNNYEYKYKVTIVDIQSVDE